jgi:hypothetical protein
MTRADTLSVNFAISPAAKREIEIIRQQWNAKFSDPAAVLMVGWGLFHDDSGRGSENVVVSFYAKSQLPEIAHGIQTVSGIEVVFFTTPQHHSKFEGKIVDYAIDRGFFLRSE